MITRSAPPPMDDASHIATFTSIADILAVFRPVMRAMAAAGGPSCEVVLHDLSDPDPDLGHTIVAIENGHVTGREVGGPSTSLGAAVIQNQAVDHNVFGYRGFTSNGRQLRCSSVYFRNPEGNIIAALCINFDVSTVQRARALLDGLLPQPAPTPEGEVNEFIGRDLLAVMDAMVTDAIREIGKPVEEMGRGDRITVLTQLDQQGVLQMRRGVESVAARLGISRVTAYAYLDEARNQTVTEAAS
ncbi:MAG: transcriptional regulator [Microbacteriaceae bacterium]|nr:MAG: transcriptional regulator [Microbacteriaceae bacterium]